LTAVTVDDAFWSPRLQTNRQVTLPAQYAMCRDTGRIAAMAGTWQPGQPHEPHIFWDSDIGKWVEAACHSLATHPDPALRQQVDDLVELIAAQQQPDGYLNSHYTLVEPQNRWTNLRDCHELYCAGHLMEAAVAHFQATGERRLLDVMCRYADHIGQVFGRGPDQRRGYCGHEEIELALVKLYQATGEARYLELATYFVDERGRQPHYFDLEAAQRREGRLGEVFPGVWAHGYAYGQAHKPLREQSEVAGHAVRAFYIYSAMVDVAALAGDAGLLAACHRLWRDVTERKMYVTGAVGPSAHNEGFTSAYDLPNESAYAETCANIALLFFAHRLLQVDGDSRYADVMERLLYNGTISGVSLDGARFFYTNPLASAGTVERQDWFGCACCPPNLARLLASLGTYAYSASDRGLWVHLYLGGQARLAMGSANVTLEQRTDYPWSGRVDLTVEVSTPRTFDLMLRLPGWCRRHRLQVNGVPLEAPVVKGYLRLHRRWQAGDRVRLVLDMPVERVTAHPRVIANAGRVALQRGPVVYCLEQIDNQAPVRSLAVADADKVKPRWANGLLGGVVVLEGAALAEPEDTWSGHLYRSGRQGRRQRVPFVAVPYATWNNRGPGEMAVWVRRG
jgi:DUF1680 family protein